MSTNVLIAGVGGVLGQKLVEAFSKRDIRPAGLALSFKGLEVVKDRLAASFEADVTRPETLCGVCTGIDLVVSVIGITRVSGKLTHMDVDYRGNMNLLAEAKRAGVRKFVFISPAGTDIGARRGVPLMEAKFMFEEELKKSGLQWVIVRASAFMSDLAAMAKTARQGSLFVIGDGKVACAPVDVGELASCMVEDALDLSDTYTSVGGPRIMSWLEICASCFRVWNRPVRIVFVPVWICHFALALIRPFSSRYYALGKMVLFFSVIGVSVRQRGKIDFDACLKHDFITRAA